MFGTPTFVQNTNGFPETQQGFGTSIGGISFDQNVASFGVSTQKQLKDSDKPHSQINFYNNNSSSKVILSGLSQVKSKVL
ncbi:hypothetical protein F8M41_011911 [Gigaspora margarita]|uniref:Uncharacterized protein n=1 Tax=Gigaspora margarita TaxID=4874 RepID=A0A8H4A095_GIGMA|nr:hypothetical protein F8M41_011911 [Gigaspora margarita]